MSSTDPSSYELIPVSSTGDLGNETMRIPVGRTADQTQVQLGTTLVVLFAFAYLAKVALKTASRISHLRAKED